MRPRLLAALLAAALASRAEAKPYFSGENCVRCHAAIRDKTPGPYGRESRDGGTYDAIVVGGGLAGLSAAYHLGARKVLVLEAESRPGGKARTETFDGRRAYSVGAVYTSKPTGPLKALFDDLGLKPELITVDDHSLYAGDSFVPNWLTRPEGNLPRSLFTEADQKQWTKLFARLREIAESGELTIPVEDASAKTLKEYDSVSFWDWLSRGYGPGMARIGDAYCRDVFGTGAKDISAYAGLLYLSAELEPGYNWEGGLGRIAEALQKRLARKLRNGAFVWDVRDGPEGVTVSYTQGRRDFKARAAVAVMAVPSHVARRIAPGLPERKREALAKVRYSSYAVVPLRLKKVLWKDSFILWNLNAFFMDVTSPRPDNAALVKDPKAGQVLAAYAPMGMAEGRRFLLNAGDDEIIARTLKDFEAMFPGGSKEVAEARVIRWGHAMPVAYPGYLTAVRPLVAEPAGNLFFAGVDTQLPAIEGALYSGRLAAEKALARLAER